MPPLEHVRGRIAAGAKAIIGIAARITGSVSTDRPIAPDEVMAMRHDLAATVRRIDGDLAQLLHGSTIPDMEFRLEIAAQLLAPIAGVSVSVVKRNLNSIMCAGALARGAGEGI